MRIFLVYYHLDLDHELIEFKDLSNTEQILINKNGYTINPNGDWLIDIDYDADNGYIKSLSENIKISLREDKLNTLGI